MESVMKGDALRSWTIFEKFCNINFPDRQRYSVKQHDDDACVLRHVRFYKSEEAEMTVTRRTVLRQHILVILDIS